MDRATRLLVENWTADYGEGHVENVCVPHAWRQDIPVSFEGPVTYRTELEVPRKPSVVRFHGVSYEAKVAVDDETIATHEGIWDRFDVPLEAYRGKRILLEVSVVKNGGNTFPVKDVASGFLPYVFNTFGGIYGEVELLDTDSSSLEPPSAQSRCRVEGRRIYVDDKPLYLRGLLHWGWYPELGHTNPPAETIRAEVQAAKALGFNLVKFCLWIPPHHYLDTLREEGLEAWIELPIWNPTDDPVKLQSIAAEIERIVRQYRAHDNILAWTLGCELSEATPPEYRRRLVNLIRNLTGCPLVKDNSGGAEMYGGDLREFGDFEDFHPYCDLPFYPPVLDSLQPGPRAKKPTLLGEFNDVDVHRNILRLADELPFWASRMPELNARGVRWQHDLPDLLQDSRFALEPRKNNHAELMGSSRKQALFVRKHVQETLRAREAVSGYVVTGLRDTPISSAGFFDDWGESRFSADEVLPWNGPEVLFQIPIRRPPWINGGNRPGWMDQFNHFAGQIFFRIGVHSEAGIRAGLTWRILDSEGRVVAEDSLARVEVDPLEPIEVGQISWECDSPGSYSLNVEFGNAINAWPINVVARLTDPEREQWKALEVPASEVKVGAIRFLTEAGTLPMPFWREAAYEFTGDSWGLADHWERLFPISPDRALDPTQLPAHVVVINRIDTRTYAEHPIAVRCEKGIITTLRPFGGLGVQPLGLTRNPSAVELLRSMNPMPAPSG